MKNKAINEFGFRRIRRIKQNSAGVIHRDRTARKISPQFALFCTIFAPGKFVKIQFFVRSSICLVLISYSASFINHYFFYPKIKRSTDVLCFPFSRSTLVLARSPARELDDVILSKRTKRKINLHFVLNWHTRLFVYFIFSEIKTNNFRVPRRYRKFIHSFIFLFLIFHLLDDFQQVTSDFSSVHRPYPGFPVISGSGWQR